MFVPFPWTLHISLMEQVLNNSWLSPTGILQVSDESAPLGGYPHILPKVVPISREQKAQVEPTLGTQCDGAGSDDLPSRPQHYTHENIMRKVGERPEREAQSWMIQCPSRSFLESSGPQAHQPIQLELDHGFLKSFWSHNLRSSHTKRTSRSGSSSKDGNKGN